MAEVKFYMPSEVARLVLGYLKASKCEKSWKTFLLESNDLKEYYLCLQQGYQYPTDIGGKSLIHILNEKGGSVSQSSTVHANSGSLERLTGLCESLEAKLSKLSTTVNDISGRLDSNAASQTACGTTEISTPRRNGSLRRGALGASPRLTPRKSVLPRKRAIASPAVDSDFSGGEPLSDSAVDDVHVKPDLIFEELINRPALHMKLAEKINRVFNSENLPNGKENGNSDICVTTATTTAATTSTANDNDSQTNGQLTCLMDTAEDNTEVHLPDNAIQDILDLLQEDPEYTDVVKTCAAKQDCFADLYSPSFSSPICGSQSLSTPTNNHKFKSPLSTPIRQPSVVVKNLLNDLKTPDKSVHNSPTSSPIFLSSPLKTNPSTPIVVPDFNMLTQSPSRAMLFPQNSENVTQKLICVPCTNVPALIITPSTNATNSSTRSTIARPVSTVVKVSQSELESVKDLRKLPKGKRANYSKMIAVADSKRATTTSRKILPKQEVTKAVAAVRPATISVIKAAETRSSLTNSVKSQRFSVTNNKVSRSLDFTQSAASAVKSAEEAPKASARENSQSSTNDQPKKKLKEDDVEMLNAMNIDEFLSRVHKS